MKKIYRVQVRKEENDVWEGLFTCETLEEAEKTIEAHRKDYYYFKIVKMYCGEKYLIDLLV